MLFVFLWCFLIVYEDNDSQQGSCREKFLEYLQEIYFCGRLSRLRCGFFVQFIVLKVSFDFIGRGVKLFEEVLNGLGKG